MTVEEEDVISSFSECHDIEIDLQFEKNIKKDQEEEPQEEKKDENREDLGRKNNEEDISKLSTLKILYKLLYCIIKNNNVVLIIINCLIVSFLYIVKKFI